MTSKQQPDIVDSPSTITLQAPARLHLGFLDLNGGLGRHFGSIGLAINSHYTSLRVSHQANAGELCQPLSAATQQKINRLVDKFYLTVGSQIDPTDRPYLQVNSLIPEHAGLGSGTQLALAVGRLLCRYHQFEVATSTIASALERGKRSGIGISTFDSGGFVVDAGLGPESSVPVTLCRYDFPAHWRIVLLMDHLDQGIHGQKEIQAFQDLPTFPLAHAQQICHLTLMQLLPALLEENISQFGAAVTQIQTLIGQHFAPAQGGPFSSKTIAGLLKHAQTLGFNGIAQSSWGPTSCVFTDSQQSAEQLVTALQNYMTVNEGHNEIEVLIASAVNQGAELTSNR